MMRRFSGADYTGLQMTYPVTSKEAKRQLLPGHHVYKSTHLLYLDEHQRDHAVVRLNFESLKAFSDTVTVGQRHQLALERLADKDWHDSGGWNAGLELPPAHSTWAMLEYLNFEYLKIASAFEIHLKARLLSTDHVLHVIDRTSSSHKALAEEQRDRPILKAELLSLSDFYFDGTKNYLPGLKGESIKFSWLTDLPKYRKALNLTDQQLDIIQDFRRLRNEIHFPGDALESPNISAYPGPISNFLVQFINEEIIHWSNQLSTKWAFSFKKLVPLD